MSYRTLATSLASSLNARSAPPHPVATTLCVHHPTFSSQSSPPREAHLVDGDPGMMGPRKAGQLGLGPAVRAGLRLARGVAFSPSAFDYSLNELSRGPRRVRDSVMETDVEAEHGPPWEAEAV